MIDPQMTVAEILKRHPESRPVLARFGLDACCGGAHPLEFACRAHHLPVDEVLAALRDVDGVRGMTAIDLNSTVRDVIAAYPSTLPVFARLGLMGCGGTEGPIEPLGWFARVHEVDPGELLAELREAARSTYAPPEKPAKPAEIARENLYRRFLKAALLFTLTGGATLGAWALILMAIRGRLGGIGRGLIQVHGHWQLFGWVGLFVVGVAYHVLPRLTGVPLPSYRLASVSFVLLVLGTVSRGAQLLDPSGLRAALLVGGALAEVAGCALFAWQAGMILASCPGPWQAFQGYIAFGTGWFVVASLLNLGHAIYLTAAAAYEVPPYLNLPYLTVFLIGFVAYWILGVSFRTLPAFMGLRSQPVAASLLTIPLTMAITTMAIGESSFLAGGGPSARWAFGLGMLGVAACLALDTWFLGIIRPADGEAEPGVDRGYEKFLRLGYAWLLISAAMLATFAALILAGREMDHALVGAYRHAITVGFITMVMVGMASRIVPIFRGVPIYSARLREATFWLLAAGNAVRVVFQGLSAFYGPALLRVAGVSGVLELAGLALFGINLWKTLNTATEEETAGAHELPPIAAETKVGAILTAYPGLLPVFVSQGFAPLANPILRRTLARGVSLGQACRMHGVDPARFLALLSEASQRLRAGGAVDETSARRSA